MWISSFEYDCINNGRIPSSKGKIKQIYYGRVPDEAATTWHTIKQSAYYRHLQRLANEEEAIEFEKGDEVVAATILQRK